MKDSLLFLKRLEDLRSDEGDSVTLFCDNPEGPPNNAIECNGGWTDWNDRRFSGETLEAAVEAAWLERAKAEAEVSKDEEIKRLRRAAAEVIADMQASHRNLSRNPSGVWANAVAVLRIESWTATLRKATS